MKKQVFLVMVFCALGSARSLPFQDQVPIHFKGLTLVPNLILGNSTAENESFGTPSSVAADYAGRLFVADFTKKKILIYSEDGKFLDTIGDKPKAKVEFDGPRSIFIDSSGNLFIADSSRAIKRNRIITLSEDGELISSFKIPMVPQKIIAHGGSVFVNQRMSSYPCNIYEFSFNGKKIGEYENVEGLEEEKAVAGMTIDKDGFIYSAGRFIPVVRRYSMEGRLISTHEYQPKIKNRVDDPIQLTVFSGVQTAKGVLFRSEGREYPVCWDIAVDGRGFIYLLVARDHKKEQFCALFRFDPSFQVIEEVDLPFLCSRIYIDSSNRFYFFSPGITRCLIRCEARYSE